MRKKRAEVPQVVDIEIEPSQRMGDVAYRAILEGLFDRRIKTGAFVSQQNLMSLLALPLQPLRDALRVLEAEGILKIHPRSGIEFLKADLELARSTYQFRSVIERAAARVFAETADSDEIAALIAEHRALQDEVSKDGLTSSVIEKAMLIEERLHGSMIASLRNPLIETTARRLKTYAQLIRMDRKVTVHLLQRTLAEHLDVLEACASGDGAAAEDALTRHFQGAFQRLVGMS